MAVQPGWYDDPDAQAHFGGQRYWDGTAWTSHTRASATDDTEPGRGWILAVVGVALFGLAVVAALVLLRGSGGKTNFEEDLTSAPAPAEQNENASSEPTPDAAGDPAVADGAVPPTPTLTVQPAQPTTAPAPSTTPGSELTPTPDPLPTPSPASDTECSAVASERVGEPMIVHTRWLSSEFSVEICVDSASRLWYHGAELAVDSSTSSITLRAIEVNGGFRADNDGWIYTVARGRLTVISPEQETVLDQPLTEVT